MEAVKNLNNPKVKLIVFGSVVKELKGKVEAMVDNINIFYESWLAN